MCTELNSFPAISDRSYLDRAIIRREDIDFRACTMFHGLELADHKLMMVNMHLGDRIGLAWPDTGISIPLYFSYETACKVVMIDTHVHKDELQSFLIKCVNLSKCA